MLPVHTILFPTDLSENAQHAFPLACALAHDCGARIVALCVVQPPVEHDQIVARRHPEEYYGSVTSALYQLRAPEQNVRVEHRVEEGDPAGVIVNVAKEIDADLIVMATHGRTGLGRLLFGSVAEQVLRKAACMVLTLKGPGSDKTARLG
jgi:nucleotide-binding universal stress UspA family protein